VTAEQFISKTKRKTIIIGHYGSGKTEFAVSIAMILADDMQRLNKTKKLAVVDLDIINPYFRSRERRDELESAGIGVYGSVYKREITAELPALGADVRAPLEDMNCRVIVDAGGNDSGAIVLNQFSQYFTEDTAVLAVVNKNRPETASVANAITHIKAIEAITSLKISAIINNSHLLLETTSDTIINGHKFCKDICDSLGTELLCDCYPLGVVDPQQLSEHCEILMPMGLYMRPTWAF
jgi:energy-coupling factor transporter ATP-binding protein EcfA2